MATLNPNTTDTVSAKLTQARGILDIITTAGQDLNAGFGEFSHKSVMDSLWAVTSLIESAYGDLKTEGVAK